MTFDVIANPRTHEYAVLRQRAQDPRAPTVADMYAPPGASVAHEHVHPSLVETFTVVRGSIDFKTNGQHGRAEAGTTVTVPAGTVHAWWNGGPDVALVVVTVDPGERFELMMKNMSFLAADGKTDDRGRPTLLQTAVAAEEFDDIMQLASPPRVLQQILYKTLAPIGRLRGLRGMYPEYVDRVSDRLPEVEVLSPDVLAVLPAGVPAGTALRPPPAMR